LHSLHPFLCQHSEEKPTAKLLRPTSNTQEELNLLHDLESKKVQDSFFNSMLEEAQVNVDADNLKWKINELNEQVVMLETSLQKAEAKCSTAQQESEIRDRTVKALTEANAKYLKDRDAASHHLKLKSQQVSSLKDSVKELRQTLEDMLGEKSELSLKLEASDVKVAALEKDYTKVQECYQASLEDLKSLPEYKALEQSVVEGQCLLDEERQSKLRALEAWEKSQKELQIQQDKNIEERRGFEMELKSVQAERLDVQRSLSWFQEEVQRLEAKLKDRAEDARQHTEEVMQLRVKLGAVETEIKAAGELEKLKAQIMIESMQSEMRWREKMSSTQIENLQKRLDAASLDKLRLQKQMAQFETAIQEERESVINVPVAPQGGQPPQPPHGRRNKHVLIKHRYAMMQNFDAEIARLQADIDYRKRVGQQNEGFLPPIHQPQYVAQQWAQPQQPQRQWSQQPTPVRSEPRSKAEKPQPQRRVKKKKRAAAARKSGWN